MGVSLSTIKLSRVNAKEHSLSKSIKFIDSFGRVLVDKIEPFEQLLASMFSAIIYIMYGL